MRKEARNLAILKAYRARVLTCDEIAAQHGITRQRVRGIVSWYGEPRRHAWQTINGRAKQIASKTRRANASKGPRLEHCTIAPALVSCGLSYGEAARILGITRNAVAGACQRAKRREGSLSP